MQRVREPESQNRWTIHDRDSWEVIPPPTPSKPLHRSIANWVSQSESSSLQTEAKPRGLDRLRNRFPKSQLPLKTGALSSIASLGSPGRPAPIPVNVNAVVMGPVGCGVSTLIQKFMTGSNEVCISLLYSHQTDGHYLQWVPASTIDDFWHHVVHTETRVTYYNLTEVTGAEEYVDLRRVVLRRAQVVLLCFRLDSRLQFRDAIVRVSKNLFHLIPCAHCLLACGGYPHHWRDPHCAGGDVSGLS